VHGRRRAVVGYRSFIDTATIAAWGDPCRTRSKSVSTCEWEPPGRVSNGARRDRAPRPRKEIVVPTWLILILVGVALVILGVATNIGQFLIWIGVIVLVVSLILGLVGRSRV
jgi:hypothetical protein